MNKRVLKTCIIICWCLLACCMLFKLFGSRAFEIVVDNKRFIEICNWLDSDGIWCRYALAFTLSTTSTTFIMLSSSLTPKPNIKQLALILGTIIPTWGVKLFYPLIGFILDCVIIIVMPAIISKKWWTGFVGLALNFAFQLMSAYIKSVDITTTMSQNTILALVFSIDYYIMIAIYYMYIVAIKNKKKEVIA